MWEDGKVYSKEALQSRTELKSDPLEDRPNPLAT